MKSEYYFIYHISETLAGRLMSLLLKVKDKTYRQLYRRTHS